jgi:hypothetical protein
MATTVQPPVTNSVGLASSYLPILDEIYQAESKSAILDTEQDRVYYDPKAHTFYLAEIDMVGNANYSRNDGFVRGDVTFQWRPYAPQWDRGRQFVVDRMDNDEAMGMVFPALGSEYLRTKVVPETDALRFSTYAGSAEVGMTATETISGGAAAVAAIDLGTEKLDDAEVPYEGRILFMNPTMYRFLKGGITRYTMNGENGIDYNVEMYNDMRVITVPSRRFNTAVTLANPTDHAGAGGYTVSGQTINFMIIHPSAIMQANCFTEPRIFAPGVWQQSQGWAWDFRQYHGAWVKHQKTNGIYLNKPAST